MVPEHPPPPGTTRARRRGWTLARLPPGLVVSPGEAPMALVLRPGPLAEPLAVDKPLLPRVWSACGLVHRTGVRQRPCSSRPGHTPLVGLSRCGGCLWGFCFTAPIPAYAREAVRPVAAAGPCSTLRRPPDPPERPEHGAKNVPSALGPVKAGVSSGSASVSSHGRRYTSGGFSVHSGTWSTHVEVLQRQHVCSAAGSLSRRRGGRRRGPSAGRLVASTTVCAGPWRDVGCCSVPWGDARLSLLGRRSRGRCHGPLRTWCRSEGKGGACVLSTCSQGCPRVRPC